jgi:hypothetical protein
VVTVVLVCTAAAACDGGAQPCFDGPTATYRFRAYDVVSPGTRVAGAEACLLMDGVACGCRVTDEMGETDYPMPVGMGVVPRLSAQGYLSTHAFVPVVHGDGYVASVPMLGDRLEDAYSIHADREVDLDLGVATVWARPAFPESLEGTVLQLLDRSGVPMEEAHGPLYTHWGVSDLLGTDASLGPTAMAFFVNLPPGTYFARAIGPDGDDLYARCNETGSGWERDLEGDLVLELEVFGQGLYTVSRFQCTL